MADKPRERYDAAAHMLQLMSKNQEEPTAKRYDAAAHMRELMVKKEEENAAAQRKRKDRQIKQCHVRFSPSTDFTEHKEQCDDESSEGSDSDTDERDLKESGTVFEVLFEHGTLGLSIAQRRSDKSIRVNSASGSSAAAGVRIGDTLLSVGGNRVDTGNTL